MARVCRSKSILFIGILFFLIIAAGFYAAAARQVLVLTDPIWNELYLEDQVKKQELSGTLLKRGYLLRTKEVPLESGFDVIEPVLENNYAGIMFLSPAVSVVFNNLYSEGGLKELNSPSVPRSIIVFGEGAGGPENRSRSTNTVSGRVVQRLVITADKLLPELETLLNRTAPAEEDISRIYLLRNRNSFVPEQVTDGAAELMRTRYPSAEVEVFTSMNDFEQAAADGTTLALLLPGFGSDNKRVLDTLNRQGGRAIVMADFHSLAAWPDTVLGTVEFDLKRIIVEALEKRDERDTNRFFSVPFTVRNRS